MSDIKVITEPSVYLVGRQTIDEGELSRFLAEEDAENWTTDTEVGAQKLAEVAGRLCYKSYAKPRPGGNAAYLGHILEVGHGSVIESAVFNFIITGVSRSLTHELVRHRAGWAYSQRSQRFCDESDGAFVEPPLIRECREIAVAYCLKHGVDLGQVARCHVDAPAWIWGAAKAVTNWDEAIPAAAEYYGEISNALTSYLGARDMDRTLRRKKAREAARSVLPNATETQIFVTANARALRTFLEQRGAKEADAEIRRVAIAIYRIMVVEAPNLFPDYEIAEADGVEYLTNKYRKV